MTPPTAAGAIDDATLPVLIERVAGHAQRLETGEKRMDKIEGKIDRLVMLQYGALFSAAGSLAVGLVLLLMRAR